MEVVVLVLVGVAVAFAVWLRGPGRRGLHLVLDHPRLFLPGLALFAGQIVLAHLPAGFAAPWFTADLPGLAIGVSWHLFMSLALDVGTLVWFAREAQRARGIERLVALDEHARALAVLSLGSGAVLLASIVPVGIVLAEVGMFALFVWGALLFWFSCRNAALFAELVTDPRLGGAWARGRARFARATRRWRFSVLVELLVVGGITFVHVERPGSTSTNWSFHAFCVGELTAKNYWPDVIAKALKEPVPGVLDDGLRALTVLITTVFLAAYLEMNEVGEESLA